MYHVRLLCYSDIHHHLDYGNGITEEDIEKVESHITQLAVEHNVDATIFCGDRFLLHAPPHSTRARADAALKERADRGIEQIILLGNHDRETKNMSSSHAFMHVDVFYDSLPAVHVLDERRTYCMQLRSTEHNLIVHAVPAGHSIEKFPFDLTPQSNDVEPISICLFHDIVAGSWLQNGAQTPKGMHPSVLDRPIFDVVLGGDNHVPQVLPFNNTKGWYVGAALQHNWGDANQKRGYLLVEIFKEHGVALVETQFISSCAPYIFQANIQLGADAFQKKQSEIHVGILRQIIDSPHYIQRARSIYKINISCPPGVKLNKPALDKLLETQLDARRVTTVITHQIAFKELVPELKTSQSSIEDWSIYVKSGKLDLDGEDPATIEAMGHEILRHVGFQP